MILNKIINGAEKHIDNKNLQITIKINIMLELGPDENNTVGKTDKGSEILWLCIKKEKLEQKRQKQSRRKVD